MLSQSDFDRFIENYNEDFYFLLRRASVGTYDCLLTSFMVLKDLHDVIHTLSGIGGLQFQVKPYPFNFRANDALLNLLGFDAPQINNIYGFLNYVKQTQGKEFEECIAEGVSSGCLPIAGRA